MEPKMKISKWNANKVFGDIYKQAMKNGNELMDQVVVAAKAKCRVGTITREGKWSGEVTVSFTPRTGRNKGRPVEFRAKRWMGREPGDLRDTIRRVNLRDSVSGNIRVYAGNTKIYWAFMVERGTSKTAAHPFLKPAFLSAKRKALRAIKTGAI